MGWRVPFIRKREPQYLIGSPPLDRETGDELHSQYAGFPDPVRSGDFDGVNNRRRAQLSVTTAPNPAFGLGMGLEFFVGRRFQPDPSAGIPSGELGMAPTRIVIARPPTRTTR